ncbi:MAG: sugar phosphate isomerase/epimerase [Candidatus Peregrinibacteria bacterium]
MTRAVTLFTGQWADLPLAKLGPMAKRMGYDGLELACWGDHFDVPQAAGTDGPSYCKTKWDLLQEIGLDSFAISGHLVGQAVLDIIEPRHKAILGDVWGDGDPAGVNLRAVEWMKKLAIAARRFYDAAPAVVKEKWPKWANGKPRIVANGFTGSSIWGKFYSFPPVPPAEIDAGFQLLADRFNPILEVFGEHEVRFALEVHPTEIAFDWYTAERALDVLDDRLEFGFNFDPSHLIWQGLDPAEFVRTFSDRIYHVHMKDAIVKLDGRRGILSSHLDFGDPRRGWDFRSLGRGDVNFEEIIRALNDVGYNGPLSVEWEDKGMNREQGAKEACDYVRRIDFAPSTVAFDAAFDEKAQAK